MSELTRVKNSTLIGADEILTTQMDATDILGELLFVLLVSLHFPSLKVYEIMSNL